MDDNKKVTDGYDEFAAATEDTLDPQSAVAAQGFKQIGQTVAQNPQVQQALDIPGNINKLDKLQGAAVRDEPGARDEMAKQSLNTAMGSIQGVGQGPSVVEAISAGMSPKTFNSLTRGLEQSAAGQTVSRGSFGKAAIEGGAIGRLEAKFGLESGADPKELLRKVEEAAANGLATQQDLAIATQRANTPVPRNKAIKIELAKGGTVPLAGDAYPAPPQIPVQGFAGQANVDPYDAFAATALKSNEDSPTVQNLSSPNSAPTGYDDFVAKELKQTKYGTPSQLLKTAAEGAAQGLVGPLAPLAEKAFGVKEEDILARAETNPGTHTVGEIAGFTAPALASLGSSALAKVGLTGAAKALEVGSKFSQLGALEKLGALTPGATSLAGKIGVGAARGIVDNALLAGSDEVSKMILNDPNQSAQTAIANIGLSGALGAGIGGALPAAGALWKATIGDKASKLVHDFKGRIQEHVNNPDPVTSVQEELGKYYDTIRNSADDVYGAQGLKAQDVAQSMPGFKPEMLTQSQEISDKLSSAIDKMKAKTNSYPARLTAKLEGDLDAFSTAVSKDGITPGEIFNAAQDLKQNLQGYSKFDKFVKPVDEAYDFVKDSKSLAYDLRNALEDTKVWGKAAERQQSINKAFKEYLPALQDFEKKFTVEVGGEKQIDPGKINTYLNQLGKPTAEIKQQMLSNFLDASEKYKKVINTSHANLGLSQAVEDVPLNVTMNTLGKKTLGAKVADAFIEKGLTDVGGKAIGASLGGGLGALLGGHPGAALGAILGQHALGPFFSSVLPSIAKGLVGNPKVSAEGFKAAVDYAVAVQKGEMSLIKSVKNVFKPDANFESLRPSPKELEKLDKVLKHLQTNPEALMNKDGARGHYLPDHDLALDESSVRAMNLLNSMRPDVGKKAPLDSPAVPTAQQKSAFNNALMIAQQPLVVLDKVKTGTLTSEDLRLVSTMYPALYQKLQQRVMGEIVNKESKKELIPYKTRIGLSMLMGQPLDSSMAPMSIQAAQPQAARGPQDEQQQGAPKKGSPSSPALQKMSKLYQTPGQARQEHATKE